MLSKNELRELNTEFWLDFKKLMSRTKSSSGKKINWLSYPTQIKNVYLRLEVTKSHVALNFDIQYKDETIRAVFWEQMEELKKVLEDVMGKDGHWLVECYSDSVPVFSRIQWKKDGLNYFNQTHKDEIFSFFKEKLIAFDSFYQNYKEILLFLAK
ncbi:MAG: DUF4268 domain-containing protein [Bacteroidota bacterium]